MYRFIHTTWRGFSVGVPLRLSGTPSSNSVTTIQLFLNNYDTQHLSYSATPIINCITTQLQHQQHNNHHRGQKQHNIYLTTHKYENSQQHHGGNTSLVLWQQQHHQHFSSTFTTVVSEGLRAFQQHSSNISIRGINIISVDSGSNNISGINNTLTIIGSTTL